MDHKFIHPHHFNVMYVFEIYANNLYVYIKYMLICAEFISFQPETVRR